MIDAEHDRQDFARVIAAVMPWLGHVIVVGGWAHRLYRLHPLAQSLSYAPVITLDTDIALPSRLPARTPDLRQQLLDHGFQEEFLGDHHPPVTHYRLVDGETGLYVEFLTPLQGGAIQRDKKTASTIRISGVPSQKLRYLDLLFHSPWAVTLDAVRGFPVPESVQVLVANPAAYMAHKLLIQPRRPANERAKDLLYLHDTLELFSNSLDHLKDEWSRKIKPALHKNIMKKIEETAESLFHHTTDIIREAAITAAGRSIAPEQIRLVCRDGLAKLFY